MGYPCVRAAECASHTGRMIRTIQNSARFIAGGLTRFLRTPRRSTAHQGVRACTASTFVPGCIQGSSCVHRSGKNFHGRSVSSSARAFRSEPRGIDYSLYAVESRKRFRHTKSCFIFCYSSYMSSTLLALSIILFGAAIPVFMGNRALSRSDKIGVLVIACVLLLIAAIASDTIGMLYRLLIP